VNVFDTSAVLAILFAETGADRAARHLQSAEISLVNVTEVISDFVKRGRTMLDAMEAMTPLALKFTPPDLDQCMRAAALCTIKGLSLGDRHCIALAQAKSATIVTADQSWRYAPLNAAIEFIR
jgi:PIN domain nuclease of toxin-antitoxin system